MTKSFARGTAAALVITGLFAIAPAMAFTHHPSTASEREQTRQLNEQQLAIAEGRAPANMTASIGANGQSNATSSDMNANTSANTNANASTQAVAPGNAQQPATSNESGAASTNAKVQNAPAQNPDEQTPSANTNAPQ